MCHMWYSTNYTYSKFRIPQSTPSLCMQFSFPSVDADGRYIKVVNSHLATRLQHDPET